MPRVLVGSGGSRSLPYSPRPRRRGLGARAAVAAAAAERFASGRSALAAPRGHGPVRALLSLSLSRDPHRGLGFTGFPLASCTSAVEAPGLSPGHGKAQGRWGPPPPGRAAGAPWPERRGRIPRCGARAAARARLRSAAPGSAGWRCACLPA